MASTTEAEPQALEVKNAIHQREKLGCIQVHRKELIEPPYHFCRSDETVARWPVDAPLKKLTLGGFR
jgi:hypothetical protein